MGNSQSLSRPKFRSQFLPKEQAEIDGLFDALSSDRHNSETSPRSFSLQALKARVTALSVEWGAGCANCDP
jgi:hypothetical protein